MSETKKQPQKPKAAAAKGKSSEPTPAKPEPAASQFATSETDEQIAKRLMDARGLGEIYQVGKYFFSDRQYAEQSSKLQGLKIKTYEK